jgi:hypothetical protein
VGVGAFDTDTTTSSTAVPRPVSDETVSVDVARTVLVGVDVSVTDLYDFFDPVTRNTSRWPRSTVRTL